MPRAALGVMPGTRAEMCGGGRELLQRELDQSVRRACISCSTGSSGYKRAAARLPAGPVPSRPRRSLFAAAAESAPAPPAQTPVPFRYLAQAADGTAAGPVPVHLRRMALEGVCSLRVGAAVEVHVPATSPKFEAMTRRLGEASAGATYVRSTSSTQRSKAQRQVGSTAVLRLPATVRANAKGDRFLQGSETWSDVRRLYREGEGITAECWGDSESDGAGGAGISKFVFRIFILHIPVF